MAQETLQRILQNRDRFDLRGRTGAALERGFVNWTFKIARFVALQQLAKGGREYAQSDVFDRLATVEARDVSVETWDEIHAVLAEMDEARARILRHELGFDSQPFPMNHSSWSKNALEQQKSRAFAQFRDLWEERTLRS